MPQQQAWPRALVWEQLLLYTTARPPPCKEGIKPAAYSLLAPSKLLSMNKAQPTKGLFVVVVSAFQTLQASASALEHCRLLCTVIKIAAEKSQLTLPKNGRSHGSLIVASLTIIGGHTVN